MRYLQASECGAVNAMVLFRAFQRRCWEAKLLPKRFQELGVLQASASQGAGPTDVKWLKEAGETHINLMKDA